MDITSQNRHKITNLLGDSGVPSFTPDGKTVFINDANGPYAVMEMDANGQNPHPILLGGKPIGPALSPLIINSWLLHFDIGLADSGGQTVQNFLVTINLRRQFDNLFACISA